MIIVHHLENSRSQRILWLLEELNLPYEIKHYQRDPQTKLAPLALTQVHPLGKSPVITDGEITIAESGAIIEYLIQKYGPDFGFEAGTSDWIDYQYWMHYAEGSLMPVLFLGLVFSMIKKKPMPFFAKPIIKKMANGIHASLINPNLQRHMNFIEAHLKQNTWFAGDKLSGADFQMIFTLEAAAVRGGLEKYYPAANDYLERIRSRPAYRNTIEKGGPLQLLT